MPNTPGEQNVMPPSTRVPVHRPTRLVAAGLVAVVGVALMGGCGGDGATASSSTSTTPSSTTTSEATTLPGLDAMEKTLATLAADTTVAEAAAKLSGARDALSADLSDMRDAVKAALDQKKANRWDCPALDAKRSAAWSVREKVTGDVGDADTAYTKLASTLKSFSAKVDDLEKQYAEVSAAGAHLLASDALTSRLDSAGTNIQGILAQVTSTTATLAAAKDAIAAGQDSADKQYATTRTLVDQCNAHWQHIHDLKNNKK